MTRIKQRHQLGALLADRLDPTRPAELVELLAAYALEDDEELRAQARELFASGRPTADALQTYWDGGTNVAPPADWQLESRWILDVETVCLAARAAEDLKEILGRDVFELLEAADTRIQIVTVEPRVWMNPLVAAESREGFFDVFPWTAIASGVASGCLRRKALAPEVLEAWLEDRLHVEDAAALRSWVAEPGAWQEAYRARIAELARTAGVLRFDVDRSVSVAADDAELERARLVQDVPLPHLGDGALREGRLHRDGTVWRLRGTTETRAQTVPHGTDLLEWEDDVLGRLVTELIAVPLDELALAEDAMESVIRLADGLEHPRASSIALAVAEDLRAGSLRTGLEAAASALEEAKLEADTEICWAACALRTQLALEWLGHRLDDPRVDVARVAAETALEPFASGLLLLDDEHYASLVDGYDIDPAAWYGIRERLDEEMPLAVVSTTLSRVAASSPARQSNVLSLADRRRPVAHDGDGRYEIRAAAAGPRVPGEVDLLVTLEGGRVGRVLRVGVRLDEGVGDSFENCRGFAPVARDAIRTAYAAVAAACPTRVPPHPLEHHRIVVHEPLEISVIDGSSLGLAFALAFASLWLDRAVTPDIAATGRIYWERGEWCVGGVDHVHAKAQAFREHLGEEGGRVLAAAEHEGDVHAFGHAFEPVSSVVAALRVAGVDLRGAKLPAAWPDQQSRLAAIHELTRMIELQNLGPFESWGDPWTFAADRMKLLVDGLAGDVDEEETVSRGRVFGALAYLHAGDPKAAGQLLAEVDVEANTAKLAFVRQIIELDAAIDREDWTRCAALREALGKDLLALTWRERKLVEGLALGTQGRSLMHAGEPVAALPFLEQAVQHHAEHCPRELARSRVYLAAGLRNAGRTDGARKVLELAAQDLESHTKPWSHSYYVQCRMYLLYEHARLAVAVDAPGEAAELAAEAYALARRQGFWPALGILRVLAWAHRMMRDAERADHYVDIMEALTVPESVESFRDRLVEEAESLPSAGDEVY